MTHPIVFLIEIITPFVLRDTLITVYSDAAPIKPEDTCIYWPCLHWAFEDSVLHTAPFDLLEWLKFQESRPSSAHGA